MIYCLLVLIALSNGSSDDLLRRLIEGGISTPYADYPFIAQMRVGQINGASAHGCGGSLIRKAYPSIVLTAAHCLDAVTDPKSQLFIRFGADSTDSTGGSIIDSTISDYIIHPNYNRTNAHNDIALIQLSNTQISHSDNIFRQVQLQLQQDINTECCYDGEIVKAIGYGAEFCGGPGTPTLEYADLHYVKNSRCEQLTDHPGWFYDPLTTLCAIDNPDTSTPENTQRGDGGSPLVKYVGVPSHLDANIVSPYKQIAVLSGGNCDSSIPSQWSDVGAFYNWIMQEMIPYHEVTTESFDGLSSNNIGWRKILSCTEGIGSNAVFNWSNRDYLNDFAKTALTIRFQPIGGKNNPNYDNFTVIAKPGSEPVSNLHALRPISCDTVAQDVNNWIGTDVALSRISTDRLGCPSFDNFMFNIFWAHTNGAGIHIVPGFHARGGICYWDWNTILGQDIEVYFGFYVI